MIEYGTAMKMTSRKRALDKIYKPRHRYEIPDWQREEVWKFPKKQRLIDSILRGWKLPKFYFLKISENPDEFEVVDGQQRLITIFEFFDNELALSNKSRQRFGAQYYKELPDTISDNFDDFELEYDEIEDADEKEIKEFFQRLQEGLPLTGSEKLNSVHSKLRDFTRKLSKHHFFQNKVRLSDTRYAYFDVVSKVAAVKIEGIDTGLRYEDLKETFESQASFSPRSNVAARLLETFDYLDRVFPERNTFLRNRTIIQSVATLTSRLIATGNADGRETLLRGFFETFMTELSHQVELGQDAFDQDYVRFQKSVSANVRSGAKTRQEILLRKLLMFDPSFTEAFDPAVVSESGLSATIRNTGEAIVTLIYNINSRYSSQFGTDLIKPTNKTTQALSRIGKMISDYTEYQTFIDDLYFVFHEGVGSRLKKNTPTTFTDVNILRTGLEHDLDHGKKSKSAAKLKKLGTTFSKYSGATSPQALAPERFSIVQANLLRALEMDLLNLT
ncbi:DUF262 domain-containing protein [Acidobacteria bacterium AH-259-D05]|nr:DUF262 domain-containing protein [Acidobacteria bacterium AH-259-D05]